MIFKTVVNKFDNKIRHKNVLKVTPIPLIV